MDTNVVTVFYSPILVIVFEFDMSVYTIEEGGPAIQVCINLVEGTLTRDVIVDVDNVIGQGTATRKCKAIIMM